MFTESFKGVSKKFKGCFLEVSRKFQRNIKGFSRKFHVFFKIEGCIRVCQNSKKFEDFIPKLGLHVDIHYKLPQKI